MYQCDVAAGLLLAIDAEMSKVSCWITHFSLESESLRLFPLYYSIAAGLNLLGNFLLSVNIEFRAVDLSGSLVLLNRGLFKSTVTLLNRITSPSTSIPARQPLLTVMTQLPA